MWCCLAILLHPDLKVTPDSEEAITILVSVRTAFEQYQIVNCLMIAVYHLGTTMHTVCRVLCLEQAPHQGIEARMIGGGCGVKWCHLNQLT